MDTVLQDQAKKEEAESKRFWSFSWRQNLMKTDQREADLKDLIKLFKRYRWMMLVLVALFSVTTHFFAKTLPDMYQATSQVMIEPREPTMPDIDRFIAGVTPDTAVVLSEVEVLKSSVLLGELIDKLQLWQDPFISDGLNIQPENFQARAHMIENLQRRLAISQAGHSLVIDISLRHPDPSKASKIVNTLANLYIEQDLKHKYDQVQHTNQWLERRLDELGGNLREAEQAVAKYRAENNLISGSKNETTVQQLSEMNSKFVEAQTRLSEAEAAYSLVQKIQETPVAQRDYDALATFAKSDLIMLLKVDEATLSSKLAEMRKRYGPRHPRIRATQAELSQLRDKLDREVGKIAQRMADDYAIAQRHFDQIRVRISGIETARASENKVEIGLRELEREASANRLIYENFLERIKQTDQSEELERPNARIIKTATIPHSPVEPNRVLMVILAAVFGLLFSIAIIIVLEQLDTSFRTPAQLEKAYQFPVLAMVPLVKAKKPQGEMGRVMQDDPYGTVAEAVRSLRAKFLQESTGQNGQRQAKIIAVSSSVPGEGKSLLAYWLAQSMAKTGRRTLLVDCDLRRPSIHKYARMTPEKGLADVFEEPEALHEALYHDPKTKLNMIFGRSRRDQDVSDIISSDHMRATLQGLRVGFDTIFIDLPPYLAISDSRVLAGLSDHMVYLVQWDKTPRAIIDANLRQMATDNVAIDGFVISQVDLKRHAKYYYGDVGTYYRKYRDYYHKSAA